MIKIISSIADIPKEHWDLLAPTHSPFLKYEFFHALEKSGSIGPGSGWSPLYLVESEGIFITFVKSHSYGEYIFDWSWARAYEQNGLDYYPKLTSMIPFTSVTTPHFVMPVLKGEVVTKLLDAHEELYQQYNFSSAHMLFITSEEIPIFESNHFHIRESIQYHFFNDGLSSFNDYLELMKSKKAKQIKKERLYPHLCIKRFTGEDLTVHHARRMYQFYLTTIDQKNAIDYLKEDFFIQIFQNMKDRVLYIEASQDGRAIAGSLFFYSNEKLYGRYWGQSEYVENLHFEMCYYQGIEFLIEKKLNVFEAGAQGEHKISRGFRPIRIYSAHKLKNQQFHQAVGRFIEEEKTAIGFEIQELSKKLPFK